MAKKRKRKTCPFAGDPVACLCRGIENAERLRRIFLELNAPPTVLSCAREALQHYRRDLLAAMLRDAETTTIRMP
jgi:hypothetical protein